ncbi:type 2 isopentenyl-diphosphate Delta-isomerase [Natranaerobius trueperi]|uniref:Isopentenyl-diphosphate delta-isomerase n=1 Tax=Natranaerobius trueperi TaxID=759412 RepID=A0A226BX90_9FIRM|nr:type 2 isopentenyl-diphosphate Delta-isomerase [Natranaerobius trueperi]OWZ82944.1 type 2 isopentenyl-diphosphate Delta-isomerase [Natranaerobius trueperi]
MIENRKSDHLKSAINNFKYQNLLKDIRLMHKCLPKHNYNETNLSTTLFNKEIKLPIMFNAITGGAKESLEINKKLARVANDLNIPIAVGSQKIAIKDDSFTNTFEVVREFNPTGLVIANVGAYATVDMAKKAVEMISADALQIHLNAPQELAMPEGDRNFKEFTTNIEKIIDELNVPVIAKEVGFGMKKEDIQELAALNFDAIDISGVGGTNFIKLENERYIEKDPPLKDLEEWGITTGESLLEASAYGFNNIDIIASGGFSSSLDIAKALSLGAKCVAMAGFPLYILWNFGEEELKRKLEQIETQLKSILLLTGSRKLKEFEESPVLIQGNLKEYANQRNLDIEYLSS